MSNDLVRAHDRAVWHKVWSTYTVCGRKIEDDWQRWPEGEDGKKFKPGRHCMSCQRQPVVTLTYQSGRVERFYAR